MIVKEFHRTRADGVNLYRTYSDQNLQIKQVETGRVCRNGKAIDVEGATFTYVETDQAVEVRKPRRKTE
jgi:hypothetical protein